MTREERTAKMERADLQQNPKEWVREWFAALPELVSLEILDRETAINAQIELASLAVAAWRGNVR